MLKNKKGLAPIVIIGIMLGVFLGLIVLFFRIIFSPITAILIIVLVFLIVLKKLDLGKSDVAKWIIIIVIILVGLYIFFRFGGIDLLTLIPPSAPAGSIGGGGG